MFWKPRFPASWQVGGSVAILATLWSGSLSAGGQSGLPRTTDARTATHVLDRLTFGARPGDVERVESMGVGAYIDQQLHPERIDDSALESRLMAFPTLAMSSHDLTTKYFLPAQQLRRDAQVKQQRADAKAQKSAATSSTQQSPDDQMMMSEQDAATAAAQANQAPLTPEARQAQAAAQNVLTELMQSRLLRDAESDRQLQEVLVDFWFNHFNVYVGKGQVREFLTAYERDAIRPHVLGSFRDLLGAVAHSPAMLFYLDNWQSASPDASGIPPQALARLNSPFISPNQRAQILARLRARQPQQGKGQQRGLNENYARELMELHTLGVDGGYTQDDVIALAKILTGWTIDKPAQGGGFVFRPEMHDQSTKKLLGVTFTPDGEKEGEKALDLLASRPATAHHIAYELSQRFVADEPPATLVDRAAQTFMSTKGDLREVVRTIVTSPEFFAADAYRSKVKTPLEFVMSSVRSTGTTIVSAQPLVAALRNLGMPLYGCQPPTGYSMTAEAWINTGALIGRMNFAVQLIGGGRIVPDQAAGRGGQGRIGGPGPLGLRGAGAGRGALARGPLQVDVNSLAPDVSAESRAHLTSLLLGGDVSTTTSATLAKADTPANLVALTLGSPEFQRR